MKNIFIFLLLILISCRSSKTIDKKSNITKNIYFDTTWTAKKNPTVIKGNLWIAGAASLKIEPGTIVHFEEDAYITVEGSLIVKGSNVNPVIFTSKNEHKKVPSLWEHIYFKQTRNHSLIQSAIFKYSRAALYIKNNNVEVIDCMFKDNNHAIYIQNASPSITRNLFRNNKNAIISYGNNQGLISNNSFEDNESTAIHALDAFSPRITQNVFLKNKFGILIKFTKQSSKEHFPEITFNDFINNSIANLYLQDFPEGTKLQAPSNYWGKDYPDKIKGPVNPLPPLQSPQFVKPQPEDT